MVSQSKATQSKEYTVEITITASVTYPDLKATNEEEAKKKAIDDFKENLIIWDCDFYNVTAEVEDQGGDRYEIQIEMEAQTVIYVQATDEDDAEEGAIEDAQEYYSLYSPSIEVNVTAEVMED